MIRDTDQILVDLIIHLLEIEHHQIGNVQQFINHRVITAHKAAGVETGILLYRRETSCVQILPANGLAAGMPVTPPPEAIFIKCR